MSQQTMSTQRGRWWAAGESAPDENFPFLVDGNDTQPQTLRHHAQIIENGVLE